jgi:hypothetical protein
MRQLSISLFIRLGLAGLLTWLLVIVLASIAPVWSYVGVRATALIVPVLVGAGFAALFVGLLSLLVGSVWAAAALVRRRWLRRTIQRGVAADNRR